MVHRHFIFKLICAFLRGGREESQEVGFVTPKSAGCCHLPGMGSAHPQDNNTDKRPQCASRLRPAKGAGRLRSPWDGRGVPAGSVSGLGSDQNPGHWFLGKDCVGIAPIPVLVPWSSILVK